MTIIKIRRSITLIGLAGLSVLLSACSNKLVNCNGVSKDGKPVVANEGTCRKIADSSATPLSTSKAKTAKAAPLSTWVKCYGIAAANKNDCGTKSTACAGSVSQSRRSDAWIAAPKGVCEKLRGARVVQPKKS